MLAFYWFLIILFLPSTTPQITKEGCLDKCGNITVPYPFGIGNDVNCALSKWFLLNCSTINSTTPKLLFYNLPVRKISVEEGTMTVGIRRAYNCKFDNSSKGSNGINIWLGDGPFRFSNTQNKFIGYGCDTTALMRDSTGQFGSGCFSLCNRNVTVDKSCSGFGCCQVPVPKSLKRLYIRIGTANNHSNVWQFNPCGFAFLSDVSSSTVARLRLSYDNNTFVRADSVIEWVAEEKRCEEAVKNKTSYACVGPNSICSYSTNGVGYRCECKEGFTGNPYIQGCEDIDECREPNEYPCHGTCKNTIGNYTCSCPLGMHGDARVGCQGFRITAIVSVIGACLLTVVIVFLILILYKKRKKERNFLKNGGMLLKHQRVRIFSEAELTKATKNFNADRFLGEGGFGSVYEGILDSTHLAIKKPKELDKNQMNQEFQQEIGIVSQVNHKNVVKLLGLCLETKVPLLVYEFISNGTLSQHIHDKNSKILATWKNRLRIAFETALALDYLHSLADPPIIHGDVKSTNILLDENFTAKVSDFGASVLISPGQTDVATKIKGTFGYLDPEYLMTGELTAMSDVYSFGVVLVELLTGKKPNSISSSGEKTSIIQYFLSSLENNNLRRIVCFDVADGDEMEEIETFAELAKQCLTTIGIKRPSMKEVADELGRLTKLHESSWNQENSEETEHLLGGSFCQTSIDVEMNQPETFSLRTFDIEYPTESI